MTTCDSWKRCRVLANSHTEADLRSLLARMRSHAKCGQEQSHFRPNQAVWLASPTHWHPAVVLHQRSAFHAELAAGPAYEVRLEQPDALLAAELTSNKVHKKYRFQPGVTTALNAHQEQLQHRVADAPANGDAAAAHYRAPAPWHHCPQRKPAPSTRLQSPPRAQRRGRSPAPVATVEAKPSAETSEDASAPTRRSKSPFALVLAKRMRRQSGEQRKVDENAAEASPSQHETSTEQPKADDPKGRSLSPGVWLLGRPKKPAAPEDTGPATDEAKHDAAWALAENDNYSALHKDQLVWAFIEHKWEACEIVKDIRDEKAQSAQKERCVVQRRAHKKAVTVPRTQVRPCQPIRARELQQGWVGMRLDQDSIGSPPPSYTITLPGQGAGSLPAALAAHNVTQVLESPNRVWAECRSVRRGQIREIKKAPSHGQTQSTRKGSHMSDLTYLVELEGTQELVETLRRHLLPVDPPPEPPQPQPAPAQQPEAADGRFKAGLDASPQVSETIKAVMASSTADAQARAQGDAAFASSLKRADVTSELLANQCVLVQQPVWVCGKVHGVNVDRTQYSVEAEDGEVLEGFKRGQLRPADVPAAALPADESQPSQEPAASQSATRPTGFWAMGRSIFKRTKPGAGSKDAAGQPGDAAITEDELDCTLGRWDVDSTLKPGQKCLHVASGIEGAEEVEVLKFYRCVKPDDPPQKHFWEVRSAGNDRRIVSRQHLLPRTAVATGGASASAPADTLQRTTLRSALQQDDELRRTLRAPPSDAALDVNVEVFVQLQKFETGTVTAVPHREGQDLYEVEVASDGRTELVPRSDLAPLKSEDSVEAHDTLGATRKLQTVIAVDAHAAAEAAVDDPALAESIRKPDSAAQLVVQQRVVVKVHMWQKGRVASVDAHIGVKVDCGSAQHIAQPHAVKRIPPKPSEPGKAETENEKGPPDGGDGQNLPSAAEGIDHDASGNEKHEPHWFRDGTKSDARDDEQPEPAPPEPVPPEMDPEVPDAGSTEPEEAPIAMDAMPPPTEWTASAFSVRVSVHNGTTIICRSKKQELQVHRSAHSPQLQLRLHKSSMTFDNVPEDVCVVFVLELFTHAAVPGSALNVPGQCIGWAAIAPWSMASLAGFEVATQKLAPMLHFGPGLSPTGKQVSALLYCFKV